MSAYYNEIDKFAAEWLRNLIAKGLIAPGDVDERDIREVSPDDVRSYTQCHLFAGIGGWSLAARLAGWPDDRPLWTGSCPCQPFSAAGKRKGTADERHLWPEFNRLIEAVRPPTVAGEQVASKDGRQWLAGVRADLEALGYAVGASDLCAAGVGAPHIRQRLWWVADSSPQRRERWENAGRPVGEDAAERREGVPDVERRCDVGRLGDANGRGSSQGRQAAEAARHGRPAVPDGGAGRLGDADEQGPQGRLDGSREGGCADQRAAGPAGVVGGVEHAEGDGRQQRGAESNGRSAASGCSLGYWDAFDIIPCLDGKARRIEPGSFPLAHGVSGRVGKLRAYGNAIVPQVAAEFLEAYQEAVGLKPFRPV